MSKFANTKKRKHGTGFSYSEYTNQLNEIRIYMQNFVLYAATLNIKLVLLGP